jgi:hypothetical protein
MEDINRQNGEPLVEAAEKLQASMRVAKKLGATSQSDRFTDGGDGGRLVYAEDKRGYVRVADFVENQTNNLTDVTVGVRNPEVVKTGKEADPLSGVHYKVETGAFRRNRQDGPVELAQVIDGEVTVERTGEKGEEMSTKLTGARAERAAEILQNRAAREVAEYTRGSVNRELDKLAI